MITQTYHLMASRRAQGFALPKTIMVNIRFESCQKPYELDRDSTVSELRQQVALDHNVPVSEVKILLGGSVLADDVTIEGSGVGMESTLFAIRQKSFSEVPPSSSAVTAARAILPHSLMAEIAVGAASSLGRSSERGERPMLAGEGDNQPGAAVAATNKDDYNKHLLDQYFVYCKICGEVRPGRLRVKCSICDGGAVLVNKGPGSWEDVLTPGRLAGTCQTMHCQQCIPVVFFKCVEQHQGEVSRTVVALQHIRPNRNSVVCITCEDIMSPVVVFPCQSSHVMCLHCFMTYCTVRLQERHFVQSQQYGYTLPCPVNCPNSLIQEQHHFCILGKREYDRYKDFAAEECLLAEGGLYCPQPECGSGFIVDAVDTRIICPHCRFLFCRMCREAAHDGECHPVSQATRLVKEFSDPDRAERAQWERQSAATIKETTKGCPGCGTRTQRDGGCMHMKCWRCGEAWCWICVKPWDRDCQAAHWFG